MIMAMMKKGMDPAAIAALIDEEESSLRPACDLILEKPEASPEEILRELKSTGRA